MEHQFTSYSRIIRRTLGQLWKGRLNPTSLYILLRHRKSLVEVPLEICTNYLAFSLSHRGWHYYTALFQEYDKNSKLGWEESILWKFHNTYQPKDISTLLPPNMNPKFHPEIGIYPWGHFNIELSKVGGQPYDIENTNACGPSEPELIQREFNHLLHLYESIKRNGYKPWKYRNGFITGTFLVKENGDRRFLLTEGNHRCAILSHLNYDTAKMWLMPDYYSIIHEDNVDSWYYVKNGQCSREEALAYFNGYFNNNGKERAKALGLI